MDPEKDRAGDRLPAGVDGRYQLVDVSRQVSVTQVPGPVSTPVVLLTQTT